MMAGVGSLRQLNKEYALLRVGSFYPPAEAGPGTDGSDQWTVPGLPTLLMETAFNFLSSGNKIRLFHEVVSS
jgi:hypothetical protein